MAGYYSAITTFNIPGVSTRILITLVWGSSEDHIPQKNRIAMIGRLPPVLIKGDPA
jgi:hypothetical protein